MKKKFALLLSVLFVCALFCGCKPEGRAVTLDDIRDFADNSEIGGTTDKDKDVTFYLAPGRGHTVGGVAGKDFAELFLENAYKITAKSGTLLPLADSNTEQKLDFVGWGLTQEQLANPLLKVPKKDGIILYGIWTLSGSGGDPGGDPGENPGEPTSGNADFYIAFNGNTADEKTRFTINETPLVPGSKEFFLTRAFTVGETFAFVSKNAMDGIQKGDEKLYPTSNKRGFTMNWDNLKGIKTSEYFMPTTITEQGNGLDDKGVEINLWANVSKSELKCIKAGTYTLYVTVYDNGWVGVFAEPQ